MIAAFQAMTHHDNQAPNHGRGRDRPGPPYPSWTTEQLAELERRSLLAEQARQLAHSLRSPLSVIGLIGETLQIDLADDDDKRRRLEQVLGAVSKLSTILSENISNTRFADGPERRIDAAAVAADLVQLRGGRVETDGAARPILIDPDGFTAAILHALHLVSDSGPDHGGNGGSEPMPLLRCRVHDGTLSLELEAVDLGTEPTVLSQDRALMIKAAERVARDHDGTLTLEPGRVIFRFPIAEHGPNDRVDSDGPAS
jgi:signal transduction histidine kinase